MTPNQIQRQLARQQQLEQYQFQQFQQLQLQQQQQQQMMQQQFNMQQQTPVLQSQQPLQLQPQQPYPRQMSVPARTEFPAQNNGFAPQPLPPHPQMPSVMQRGPQQQAVQQNRFARSPIASHQFGPQNPPAPALLPSQMERSVTRVQPNGIAWPLEINGEAEAADHIVDKLNAIGVDAYIRGNVNEQVGGPASFPKRLDIHVGSPEDMAMAYASLAAMNKPVKLRGGEVANLRTVSATPLTPGQTAQINLQLMVANGSYREIAVALSNAGAMSSQAGQSGFGPNPVPQGNGPRSILTRGTTGASGVAAQSNQHVQWTPYVHTQTPLPREYVVASEPMSR
ncbi:hypothetical protein ACSFA3_02075 [Variovorax sp. RHLX14]|uniref:hypothetical protein n=1 Tax=Variovorax sp. RHLX14 TaxID=1259731 RepID=UPI003F44D0C0